MLVTCYWLIVSFFLFMMIVLLPVPSRGNNNRRLTCENFYDFQPLVTNFSFCFYSIFEGYIMHFIIHDANKNIIPAIDQAFYGVVPHSTRDKPVETRW